MSDKKENEVSLKLQKIYCCAGAQFCSSYLEMGWLEINKLEAERDALQARIKQLEAELEEERQENASLRSGDDYERGAE
jgi:cell division protein FtsB